MVVRRNIYKGVYLQRGSGIGSVLSLIFRALVPWVKRGASAIMKSKSVRQLAKKAGTTAIQSASKLATDVITGKSAKKSASVNLKQAKRGLQEALSKAIQPPVKKKKVIVTKVHRRRLPNSLIA